MSRCAYVRVLVSLLALLGALAAQASGRGQHKQLFVVPTRGPVVVDGKLDDWDLSAQIHSYVIPETAEMQSGRFAMMYDADAVYISAVVRDSSPMMNRHDPLTDPRKAWDADVCQVFFSLNPDLPYPIKASSFAADPRAPAATMYLWYYTDRKEPCLAIYRGMRFSEPLQPTIGAEGVIPNTHFSGAFQKQPDGKGYVLEYRIPWKTLDVTRVPKANDILAATFCLFWSRADGLKTAGGSAWAYDVMGAPGFPFQSSECWGKLLFTEKGNLPREMVEAGTPPEKPLPLTFTFTVPRDGEVTVQLMDKDNQVVRILVAQQPRGAGENVERWDGLDSAGNPLPMGTYTWKGVYHDPITTKYRFSAHNAGNPAYPTDDNRGGWGGDHGTPTTVCTVPGGMVLAWNVCEYGWGIIRVDADGKKLWGSKYNAEHLATDGTRLFIAGGHGFDEHVGVQVLDLADSRPLNFGQKTPTLLPPDGGAAGTNDVTGLAHHAGRIYAAYGKRDCIAIYDAATGAPVTTWAVPSPGRMAVRPDGSLAVISAGTVVIVADGKVAPWIATKLDEPVGIAVAPDGTAFVANRGKLQNVSVFSKDGAYLRSIGKAGGRPAMGKYDRQGMYMPGGIGLDAQGRLWVAETTDGPKRIGLWDTKKGKNLRDFFGSSGYFGYGFIDPAKPNEMLAHHVLWKIDWKANSVTPTTTVWRKTSPNMMEAVNPEGYGGVARIITAKNGRQYMWGGGRHKSILLRRDGDLFKPFAAVMYIGYGWSLYSGQSLPVMDNKAKYPNGSYFWQDANDDQCVQPEEVVAVPKAMDSPWFMWLEPDLSLRIRTGHALRPLSVSKTGQPLYDITKAEVTPLVGNKQFGGYFSEGPDGEVYTYNSTKGPSLIRWTADGKPAWSYPNILNWHASLNLPIVGPGRLWGMTGPMGVTDRFMAYMTYFGANHVFTRDGVYVAALLGDGRLGGRGADEGQPEGQGGQFVKLKLDGKERHFIIHGGQDSRVWEVLGLDTVQPLAGGAYEHTAENAELAATKLAAYKAAILQRQQLTIVRGKTALDLADPVSAAVDSNRKFDVRGAYDAQNLYLRFDVTSPSPLLNAVPETQLLFRGGNALDIQIATDLKADPKRKTPAAGDMRFLVTQQGKTPLVMWYQPKVAGFAGTPQTFTSPTGKEAFDAIAPTDKVTVTTAKATGGFRADVTIPLALLGIQPAPGMQVKMDLGFIFGNAEGTRTAVRAYWKNKSFTANVVNDIPHESRLEPAEWGTATFE
jgi:hypothetical protein